MTDRRYIHGMCPFCWFHNTEYIEWNDKLEKWECDRMIKARLEKQPGKLYGIYYTI